MQTGYSGKWRHSLGPFGFSWLWGFLPRLRLWSRRRLFSTFEKARVSPPTRTLLIIPAWGSGHLFLSHPLLLFVLALVP